MALTPSRWLAAFVAGCLFVLCFGLTIPEGRWYGDLRDAYRQLRAADQTAKVAATRLRTSIVVDSAKRALARVPVADTSRWLVSPGFQAKQIEAIRRLRTNVSLYRAGPHTNAIDVVFVHDAPSVLRGVQLSPGRSNTYVLPSRAGERCTALVRLNQHSYPNWIGSHDFASRLLGPCAYYEAYGQPGPQIDRWLRDGAWRLARLSTGDRAPGPWTPPNWMRVNKWEAEGGHPLREYVPLSSAACLAGDAHACTTVLVSDQDLGVIPIRAGNTWTVGAYDIENEALALGPRAPYLLSEMARTLGSERFKRFWMSTADPTQAFRDAASQDVGEWTADWSRRMYGPQSLGPGVPVTQASLSITIIVLCMLIAMFASRRRQMKA